VTNAHKQIVVLAVTLLLRPR